MSNHTPGPWLKTTENRGAIPEQWRPFVVTDEKGYRVIARLPDGNSAEDAANARLIAAAPELLAACKAVLPILERVTATHLSYGGDWLALNAAREAIAKAEGGDA